MGVKILDVHKNSVSFPEADSYSLEKGTKTVHVYKAAASGLHEEIATVTEIAIVRKYDTPGGAPRAGESTDPDMIDSFSLKWLHEQIRAEIRDTGPTRTWILEQIDRHIAAFLGCLE